jgi:hypothetical protein
MYLPERAGHFATTGRWRQVIADEAAVAANKAA